MVSGDIVPQRQPLFEALLVLIFYVDVFYCPDYWKQCIDMGTIEIYNKNWAKNSVGSIFSPDTLPVKATDKRAIKTKK